MDGINFDDAIIENGYIYFFDNLIQAMCRADLKTYGVEVLAELDSSEKVEIYKIYSYGKAFFLIGILSVRIFRLDREQYSYIHYEYNPADDQRTERYSSFQYKNKIWFFPFDNQRSIVCFDMISEEFFPLASINYMLKNNANSFSPLPTIYEDAVYLGVQGTNRYNKYNLSTGQVHAIDLKNSERKICSILQTDSMRTWIFEDKSSDLICVEDKEKIIHMSGELEFSRILNLENYVCWLPRYGNHLILVDKLNDEVKDVELPLTRDELAQNSKGRSNFIRCIETDSAIFVLPYGVKVLINIAKNTLKPHRIQLHFINYEDMVARKNISSDEINMESLDVNLNHLLKFVSTY